MDALKQIPQSFFEFFARLVPGAVAFALWLGLFGGGPKWKQALLTVTAGLLRPEDVLPVSLGAATATCYVVGQLAAPFGKVMQRLCENMATVMTRHEWLGRAILTVQKLPAGLTAKDRYALRKAALDLAESEKKAKQRLERLDEEAALRREWLATALEKETQTALAKHGEIPKEPDKSRSQEAPKPKDYDWLRANAPELGALAAKIRAEHTMFHSISVIFLAAFVVELAQRGAMAPTRLAILFTLGVACAVRGYSVSETFRETSKKLRDAAEARLRSALTASRHLRIR